MSVNTNFCIFTLFTLFLIAKTQTQTPITLQEVLDSRYSTRGYGASWISDTELQTISAGNISIFDVVTGTTNDSMTYGPAIAEHLRSKNSPLSSVSYSADRQYLLITHSRKSLWRSSFTAKYDVYNIGTGDFSVVQPIRLQPNQAELQLVRWSPTGNALVFVHENDIYYYSSAANAYTANPVRLTSDGVSTVIYNGHADWVYEEEMFGSNNALWFSPDSTKLAFVRFDDTNVDTFEFPKYGEPGNPETVYPEQIKIKYPKAGKTNPTYSVRLIPNLAAPTPTVQTLSFGSTAAELREYVASVQWANNNELLVITLNRPQNNATTFRCVSTTSLCASILNEAEPTGWIDVDTPRIDSTGATYIYLRYNPTSGQRQIFQNHGVNTIGVISSGLFYVSSIIAWDAANKKIYFSGTAANNADPSQSQIYSVDDDRDTTDAPVCITCGPAFTNEEGKYCLSNSFSFSRNFSYVIHSCGGPEIPTTVIRNTGNWSVIRTMVTNDELRTALQSKQVPIVRDYTVPVGNGFNASVRLILPSDFDQNKKYPLFIDVYGGPGSKQITQGFGINWGTSLVSDRKVIYGLIDGRGSGRQTKNILFQLNRVLGTVEIEDQILATKYMIENHPFIDANRTAIWGWSYGGYATAMVMSKDTAGIFKCGISVAPVTNWLYYDTIYTERYMKLPTQEDNWDNYNSSDVTTHVENFRTKKFFLVHGNADDNVHYQQSMVLSRALEQNDILFRQLSYPDENHGISGTGMRRHLYHSLENFLFTDCFAETQSVDPAITTTPSSITTTRSSGTPTTPSITTTTDSSGPSIYINSPFTIIVTISLAMIFTSFSS